MGTLSLGRFLSATETGALLIGCRCLEVSLLSLRNRAAEIGSFIQCVHESCQSVGLLTLPSVRHIAPFCRWPAASSRHLAPSICQQILISHSFPHGPWKEPPLPWDLRPPPPTHSPSHGHSCESCLDFLGAGIVN